MKAKVLKHRHMLLRTLVTATGVKNLQFLDSNYGNGHVSITPFKIETPATHFIDGIVLLISKEDVPRAMSLAATLRPDEVIETFTKSGMLLPSHMANITTTSFIQIC